MENTITLETNPHQKCLLTSSNRRHCFHVICTVQPHLLRWLHVESIADRRGPGLGLRAQRVMRRQRQLDRVQQVQLKPVWHLPRCVGVQLLEYRVQVGKQ